MNGQSQGTALAAPSQHGAAAPPAGYVPYPDMERMAKAVVQSGIFPAIRTEPQALALMLLCQSEGLHPIQAMRRYHIIQGQVSVRTDAMLADFQKRGGKVKWIEVGYERCEAEFHTPGLVEPVRFAYTMEDARRAGLANKDNYLKDPRSMLKARVISGGLRLADPGAVVGLYPPEEVMYFEPPKGTPVEQAPPDEKLGDSGAVPMAAQPLGPDGEDTTTGEILERAAANREAAAGYLPPEEDGAKLVPAACNLCGGPIGRFISHSKKYPGRAYNQCDAAHSLKESLLNEGVPNARANQQIDLHYRDWAEPWPRKKEAAHAAA